MSSYHFLEVARGIADRLFVNNSREMAERLVLELPGKRDGGGWCYSAVVDQIVAALYEKEKSLGPR